MKKILQQIFSVKNVHCHKVWTILGLKIKFKTKNDEKAPVYCDLNLREYISHEIFIANYVKELHTKTFLPFKNINTGKSIVILATGPTMKYFSCLDDPETIYIGVNKAFKGNIKLDYIFTGDYRVNKDYIEEVLEYPAKKFFGTVQIFGDILDATKLPVKYNSQKDVYPYVSDFPRNLCQPEISQFGVMDFCSIAFNATHFAFYTNPNKIYLVGCDCSNNGCYDNSVQNIHLPEDILKNGWEKVKKFRDTYYPDTEIISINPVGLKGVFKDIYTKSYLDSNPQLAKELGEI